MLKYSILGRGTFMTLTFLQESKTVDSDCYVANGGQDSDEDQK